MNAITRTQASVIAGLAMRDYKSQLDKHPSKRFAIFFETLESDLMDVIEPEQLEAAKAIYLGVFDAMGAE